jgi:cation diffusion facilitator family transporter
MSAGGDSSKVIIFALLANLGIAVSKFVAAFISGSASMLAEAIHSLVDTTNQVLLLIGGKQSKKAPTDIHPLGFGREAFFWSFMVAIMLFSLGGMFAIYEGVHKLEAHEAISSPLVGLTVLIVSLVLEGFSFRACLQEVKKQNKHGSLATWFKKTTSSDLLVVFMEDAAAMLGLVIATACLLIAWQTGNPVWDAVGSIAVGCVLVVVAVLLAIEIKSLMIGEAPSTDFRSFLEQEIPKHIPDGKLLRLIALQTGARDVLLSFKVSPGSVRESKQLIEGINSLERETKSVFPEVRWQFVEPDFSE